MIDNIQLATNGHFRPYLSNRKPKIAAPSGRNISTNMTATEVFDGFLVESVGKLSTLESYSMETESVPSSGQESDL